MICYDAIFFSQGVLDMAYWRKMLRHRKECAATVMAPIAVGVFIFLYALCSPTNYGDFGHLFFYPLFAEYWLQCLYTTGTWVFVYTTVWLMAAFGNSQYDGVSYKYVTGAALYAYLSHYFFILIISVLLVRPYQIGFIPALFIMLFGTFFLIFITYWPLNALYELAYPPKETQPADSTPEEGDERSPEKQKENADDVENQDPDNDDPAAKAKDE